MTEEAVKGWFHALAGAYVAILLGHNIKQACVARQPRHLMNVVIYAPAVLFELAQAKHHWGQQQ